MVVHVCKQNCWLQVLLSKLREKSTSRSDFRYFSNLLGEYLLIQAINEGFIPTIPIPEIYTPTGSVVDGGVALAGPESIMAVSIVRAGNAFFDACLRIISPEIQMGQLVIQRDEETALPKTSLEKLPSNIQHAKCVIVLDPMLATGGSVLAAIDLLAKRGVKPERIVLIHALGCPEGIAAVQAKYPTVKVVVGVEDSHLNERKFIIPGLGDFGDRFYAN